MKSSENREIANIKTRKYRTDDIDTSAKQELSIPVVQEELKVGKQQIERGGVRVESRVVEQPVEETVELREENVHVERKAANRPLTDAEVASLHTETIEFVERAEIPIVIKEARVVEEVHVTRDNNLRSETIKDTVKHTEVFVERLDGQQRADRPQQHDFSRYDQDFRSNFAQGNYAGYRYDDFVPAYRYGYDLGFSDRYRGRDWSLIDREAGLEWEKRNPGTWERVKGAVRHAWSKATGSLRD